MGVFFAGAGGPETYTGKDMISAHKGMNITEAEYAAVTEDILMALSKNHIDDATAKDVTAIFDSLGEPGRRRLSKPLLLVVPLFGRDTLEVFGQLKVGVRKFEVGDLGTGIGRQPRLVFEVGSPLPIKI